MLLKRITITLSPRFKWCPANLSTVSRVRRQRGICKKRTSKTCKNAYSTGRKMQGKVSIRATPGMKIHPERIVKRSLMKRCLTVKSAGRFTWGLRMRFHRLSRKTWWLKTYGYSWKDQWLPIKTFAMYRTWSLLKVYGTSITSSKRWKFQLLGILKLSN